MQYGGVQPLDPVDVSVIIVNYNTAHLLGRLFDCLGAARGALSIEVIVVDNASTDSSVALLRTSYRDIQVIENKLNVGFGRANNQAVKGARGRYILLLNTDAFVSHDTLAKTIDYMDKNIGCGVLGAKLVGADGSLQPSCRYFPTPWNVFVHSMGLQRYFRGVRLVDDMAWDHSSIRECDWVPGCYYLIRRQVIDEVGLFDPRYFLYYEEVDHCRAVRSAGWTVTFYPFTTVEHIGGESAESVERLTRAGRQISALQIESQLLYFRKHHGLAGIAASVFLTIVGEVLKAGKRLVRDPLKSRPADEVRIIWSTLKLAASTRLGSRPTR